MCFSRWSKIGKGISWLWDWFKSWFNRHTYQDSATVHWVYNGTPENDGSVCVCATHNWDECKFCANNNTTNLGAHYTRYLEQLALEAAIEAEKERVLNKNKLVTAMVYFNTATSTIRVVNKALDSGAFHEDLGFHFAVLGLQQVAEKSMKSVISIVDGLHYKHALFKSHSLTALATHLKDSNSLPEYDEYIIQAAELVESYNSFNGTSACVAARYPHLLGDFLVDTTTSPITSYSAINTWEIKEACETIYHYCLLFINEQLFNDTAIQQDPNFQLTCTGDWWLLKEDGYYVAKVPYIPTDITEY